MSQPQPSQAKPIQIDGRVGEGGGQLVRVAISLAAITGTPISIDNVRGLRGNRYAYYSCPVPYLGGWHLHLGLFGTTRG